MANKTGNYTAFYVAEPFNPSNLGAHATRDFVTYNQLRAWKGLDNSFPFVDSHDKTYNVRDSSDWEKTLKPRLRERLNKSKNIILILSSVTTSSKALKEEIDYGVNTNGLPVIVIYPEYKELADLRNIFDLDFSLEVKNLWDKLPIFRDSMASVPTLHIPNKKSIIEKALKNTDFCVASKCKSDTYYYPA